MSVALEKGGWMWHLLLKRNKRAAVVKITRESDDTIVVAPKVLYGVQRLCIKAFATLQMTPLAFVDRGLMERAHFKDEKYSARLLGERLRALWVSHNGSNWSTRRRGFWTRGCCTT